jgi:hypothetical protein
MWKAPSALFVLFVVLADLGGQPAARVEPAAPPGEARAVSIPTDSLIFVSLKVSSILENPAARPLRDWLVSRKNGLLDSVIGLPLGEVERITLFLPDLPSRSPDMPFFALVKTSKPYNEAKVLKLLGDNAPGAIRVPRLGGRVARISGVFDHVLFIDERTVLFLPRDRNEDVLSNFVAQLISKKPDGPLAAILQSAGEHDIAVGLDVRGLTPLFDLEQGRPAPPKELIPYQVLFRAKTASFTADFGKTAKGRFDLTFTDEATARRAARVLEEAIKSIDAYLGDEAQEHRRTDPAGRVLSAWVRTALETVKVTRDGTHVHATVEDLPFQEDLARFVGLLPKSLPFARSNTQALNNLKQLAIAMHNFHDTFGYLPGDVRQANPKKKLVPMSWRVQILPFIEQGALYNSLDMNLPWDAPANLKVLAAAEMPRVFEIPGRPAPKGHTYFRIFSMPRDTKELETNRPLFKEGELGPTIVGITDGTSQSIMIVEARDAVPWYEPDLLAYDGKLPLPPLGAKDADQFVMAFGDGSVRVMRPSRLGEKTLRALITIQGGEIIPDLDKLQR